MYRVHGNDGAFYEASSLAVLQQWVTEGRIVPSTIVEDLLSRTEGPASGIEGLKFPGNDFSSFSDNAGQPYPRAAVQMGGCAMHAPLVFAVISTLCCTPIGVIGVVFAAKVPEIVARGDLKKANQYARIANIISCIGFVLFILEIMFLKAYGKELGLPLS